MTDLDSTPPSAAGERQDDRNDKFVRHLLMLRRDNPGARAELRRGDTAALSHRAVPYLASWHLTDREVNAALLFGAAICRYDDIAHVAGHTFGAAAFSTLSPADRRDAASTSVGRRVVAAQRQMLPLAHRTFTGLLTSINANPRLAVDWVDLWRTYRRWDQPDVQGQRLVRRRLLLDFYGTNPTSEESAAS